MKKLSYHILRVLNILLAGALLFSYLAPYINPATFALPALFGLAYPYLLILNLLFICLWLIQLKKAVFLSLVVVLIGWGHLNHLLPLNGKSGELPEDARPLWSVKLMSYNVRGFNRYNWNTNPNVRNDLFTFLQKEKPDILCFQEFHTSSQGLSRTDIASQLPFVPHQAIYYTGSPESTQGFGIATYSAHPILKRSRIPFNSSNNAAMYTDLAIHGDTIRVFNIHLQSIRLRNDNYAFMDTARISYSAENMKEVKSIGARLKAAFIQRSDQANMIANYIKASPYTVVAMGDFNDTPQSYAYRRIRKGLQDAFRKAGHGFGNTYAGELPSFRIDHILVQAPLLPYHFERIKKSYSDHFPISCHIYMPGEGPVALPNE